MEDFKEKLYLYCSNHYYFSAISSHFSLTESQSDEMTKKKTNAKTKTIKEYFQKDSVGDIVISIFCDTHS